MAVQDRLIDYAAHIYTDAVDHFRQRHFYFCGIISSAVVSIAVFLLTDQGTPTELLRQADDLRKAAEKLTGDARLADMERASLSGKKVGAQPRTSEPDALSLFFQDAYLRSKGS